MFSRYKKPNGSAAATPPAAAAAAGRRGRGGGSTRRRRASRSSSSTPAPRRRTASASARSGCSDIKLELHRALLDNLNLAALDTASEEDLRDEIQSIATETLQEKAIVLNREERQALNQELYDEVKGLGPLETLLKDDTVSDILVNGPHQIFIEHERQAEAVGRHLQGRAAPSADHRQDRVGRGPARRRIEPLCRRAPRRRLALQRDGAAHRGGRQPRVDPEVQEGQARHRRSGAISAPSPRRWRSTCRRPSPAG